MYKYVFRVSLNETKKYIFFCLEHRDRKNGHVHKRTLPVGKNNSFAGVSSPASGQPDVACFVIVIFDLAGGLPANNSPLSWTSSNPVCPLHLTFMTHPFV